jgi:hypothetical protein
MVFSTQRVDISSLGTDFTPFYTFEIQNLKLNPVAAAQ